MVKFTPLTVLIGDNGSGKSSLVEGLRTYQKIVTDGLDAAMGMWRGFEYITNPPRDFLGEVATQSHSANSVEFVLRGQTGHSAYRTAMTISLASVRGRHDDNGTDEIFVERETIQQGRKLVMVRGSDGQVQFGDDLTVSARLPSHMSIVSPWLLLMESLNNEHAKEARENVLDILTGFNWQFISLNPYSLGDPRPLQRTDRRVSLNADGSNIAEYLLDIRQIDEYAYSGIVESLQFVLPYLTDLQPKLTSELARSVYLQMTERDFKVPGWLLSTGTLRILCLLALFRHPEPPPLIVIEELENGLDPRIIHFIVEELRHIVQSGRSQVIVTSHSPYLLDLLPLEYIVLVERVDRVPTFSRPADDDSVRRWSRNFAPGRLYTMGNFGRE